MSRGQVFPSNRHCFVTLQLDLPNFIELLGWMNILASYLATFRDPTVKDKDKITLTTSEVFQWFLTQPEGREYLN